MCPDPDPGPPVPSTPGYEDVDREVPLADYDDPNFVPRTEAEVAEHAKVQGRAGKLWHSGDRAPMDGVWINSTTDEDVVLKKGEAFPYSQGSFSYKGDIEE